VALDHAYVDWSTYPLKSHQVAASALTPDNRSTNELREEVENISGFRKEIDHALERISAIEKHLGIDKKIRA